MSGSAAGTDDRDPRPEEATEDAATGRRELLAGLLGALAGGGVLAGARSAEAAPFKDLFDELDEGEVKGLIKLLIRAFTLAAPVPIPPAVWGMINVLLEYLGKAGGDTMTRSRRSARPWRPAIRPKRSQRPSISARRRATRPTRSAPAPTSP
jgi:hypothetical protein